MNWSFPQDKEVSIARFVILKSTAEGFEKIAAVDSDKRTFTDNDFRIGVQYSYKVVSQSPRGVSSPDSNTASLIPLSPPMPPGKVSFKVSDNSVIISWEKVGDGVLYNVYRRYSEGTYDLNPVNKSPLSDNSFKDAFDINRPVYYTIRCLRSKETRDEGPASAEISIDPSDLTPSSPGNVRFFAAPDKVYLYWEGPEDSWITGFNVYRRNEGESDYRLIGKTQVPAFVDAEIPSVKRDYRINAVGPVKEGPGTEIKDVKFNPE